MNFFRNLSLSAKLTTMVAGFLVLFAAFAAIAYETLEKVRVNGPLYAEITRGKDLVADVLPPPQYILETHLVTLQLIEEGDPARAQALHARAGELRVEFENRHAYWTSELPRGPLADAMNATAYRPAAEYFDLRDRDYLPALRAGDLPRARAVLEQLRQRYEAHRRGVDEVVRLTRAQNQALERRAEDAVAAGKRTLQWLGALVVAVVLAIALVFGRIASALTRRIELAGKIAARVADGDLTSKVPENLGVDDEGARLLVAIRGMTESLHALVTRTKQASIELMSTATEFTATSRQQEATISGFGASTNEIAAAAKEISATSAELLATMEGVNSVAGQTAQLAEHGRVGLQGMEATMTKMERATGAIAARLAAIREKTSDISSVVTTITKVADQTNLLSVNAAIEAEKAGEHGLGFLVLAREIRRLADQTAVATLDIEQMVRHMQTAVNAGVMEMDHFAAEVKSGVASVDAVSGQLGQIITQVKTLSERFDSVNHGMRSQSQGARQISEAMAQLMDGARQSATTLKEFNSATNHLRDGVAGLKAEITRFRVGE